MGEVKEATMPIDPKNVRYCPDLLGFYTDEDLDELYDTVNTAARATEEFSEDELEEYARNLLHNA